MDFKFVEKVCPEVTNFRIDCGSFFNEILPDHFSGLIAGSERSHTVNCLLIWDTLELVLIRNHYLQSSNLWFQKCSRPFIDKLRKLSNISLTDTG